MPEFYMIFARKMSEFSIKIARRLFSRILGAFCRGGTCPLPCRPFSSCAYAPKYIFIKKTRQISLFLAQNPAR